MVLLETLFYNKCVKYETLQYNKIVVPRKYQSMKLHVMKILLANACVLIAIVLTACGGGGGSGGDDDSTDNQTSAVWGQTNWDESKWQ